MPIDPMQNSEPEDIITVSTPVGKELAVLFQEWNSLFDKEQYDSAVIAIQKALLFAEKNCGPNHYLVGVSLHKLVETYRKLGQYAQAEPLCRRELAIFEKAYGPNDPIMAESIHQLAQLYDLQGQWAQAEPLYRRSLAIAEKVNDDSLVMLIKMQLETNNPYTYEAARKASALGDQLYGEEKFEEALKQYTLSLELWHNYKILSKRGHTLCMLNRREEGLSDFERALELDPDDYYTRFLVCSLNFDYEHYEEALKNCNRALELHPDKEALFVDLRSSVLHKLKRFKEALRDYNRSLELQQSNSLKNISEDVLNNSITRQLYSDTLNDRGNMLDEIGLHEEAIRDYNSALEIRPDDPDTFYNRGIALANLKRYEEALKDYNRALELEPDAPDTLCNRGFTFFKLRSYEEALNDYSRLLKLHPDYTAALCRRGLTYAEIERYEEALKDYNRALELEPNDPITLKNRDIAIKELKRRK